MPVRDNVITELKGIFPQHNAQTIVYIYDDVLSLYGVGVESELILPSCIERMLELPDNFVIPSVNSNQVNNEVQGAIVNIKDEPTVDKVMNFINSNDPPVDNVMNFINYRDPPVNKLFLSRENPMDDSYSSDEVDTAIPGFEEYHARERAKYRDKIRPSTSMSSVSSSGTDYFPNDGSDELLLLEDVSTPQDKIRHNVYDKDDVEIVEVNTPARSFLNETANSIGKKRKQMDNELAHSAKKKRERAIENLLDTEKRMSNAALYNNENPFLTTKENQPPMTEFDLARIRVIQEDLQKIEHELVGANGSTFTAAANMVDFPVDVAANVSTVSLHTITHSTPIPVTVQPIKTVILPCPVVKPIVNIDFAIFTKGMKDFEQHAKNRIKAVIEDVTVKHVEDMVRKLPDGMLLDDLVSTIVTNLLDNRDYPKELKVKTPVCSKQSLSPIVQNELVFDKQPKNLLSSSSSSTSSAFRSSDYVRQAIVELQQRFPHISTRVFKTALSADKNNYSKAYKKIELALIQINNKEKRVEETLIVSFLKGRRYSTSNIGILDPLLQEELNEIQNEKKKLSEEEDHKTAIALNTRQYEEDGQAIECGCCYIESPFDDMVQCMEGHLFCSECLRSYSKEATYGSGKSQLECMTDGCEATFPMSQLQKALPEKILSKFFEREQDESLKLANLENLFKCPHCDFAAEVGEGDKVFSCQNPSCMKETCMHCKEPWDDAHFGIPCNEVEKKTVTNLRTTYEEKMTQAKVRECWQCKTIFLKSTGCNKMTCRCGAKMCYICRTPKIDYSHFCQHLREPGQSCRKCNACSLWTDPEEDDNRAVAEIQKEAEEERKKITGDQPIDSTNSLQQIGPKIDVTAPKPKQQRQQQHRGGGGHRRRRRGGHYQGQGNGNNWMDVFVNMQGPGQAQ